ncbi:hypothetical protein ACIO3O_27520 [Streptomyces sp. NPDC087440]|uniref:hypothetical protein n=1 Tax=Streptomyces sp. NPDC087440 TaxID=3365790 RepID=UPI0037F9320B
MTEELSDEEIHAAVRRRLKPGASASLSKPVRLHRARCTVDRLDESRREVPCEANEKPADLDTLISYDTTLKAAKVPAPRSVSDTEPVRLFRHGSLSRRPCAYCSEGRMQCPRCKGAGRVDCPPRVPCEACKDSTACRSCDGSTAGRHAQPEEPDDDDPERVRCLKCRTPGVACASCRGMGRINCPECRTTGSVACPECAKAGTIPCGHCEGTGQKVTWTEGHVGRTHTRQVRELPESWPGMRVRWKIKGPARWSEVLLRQPDDPLPALLEEGHRAELQQFRTAQRPDPGSREILRTVRLSQLALYRVGLSEDPNAEFYVFPTADGVRAVKVASGPRVQLITAAAVLAALVAVLVLTLVR